MNVSGTNDEALGGRRPPLPGSFGRGGGEEGMVSCGGKRGRRRMLAGLLSCSNETKTKFEEDACSVDGVPRGKREWRRGGMKKWRSRVGPPSRDDGRGGECHGHDIARISYMMGICGSSSSIVSYMSLAIHVLRRISVKFG